MLRDLLSPADQSNLDHFRTRLLRSPSAEGSEERVRATSTPYMDPVLRRHPKQYKQFVLDLLGRGMLHLTLQQEEVAAFFVKKKNGLLRLIIDARRTNERFREPPGVQLCTSEGLSRIEV